PKFDRAPSAEGTRACVPKASDLAKKRRMLARRAPCARDAIRERSTARLENRVDDPRRLSAPRQARPTHARGLPEVLRRATAEQSGRRSRQAESQVNAFGLRFGDE